MADRTRVFYDSQCGICQTAVCWLRFLDRHQQTECIPITAGSVGRAGLNAEACARELHAVTPQGVLAGWDAVSYLARLFPPTWPIGALGSMPPFRWLGRSLYRWVAAHRCSHGKCR
jgi:predicted DCC family thiol-disulfide oxidoreductase YuxK